MTKVSIVVPIYNAEKTLKKCIRSILNQTFKEFELILVNDGSTDNSIDICNKYKKIDDRIIIINKRNEGSIATRRKGVEACKSDLAMFVDADDWISKNTLEILYRQSMESNADITVCNIFKVLGFIKKKNKSRYFISAKTYLEEDIRKELVTAYFHGHPFPSSLCAKLYKKELLLNSGKYLKHISFLGEDLYYNLEMLIKSKRIRVINETLYYYRMGGNTSKYMPYLFEDMVSGYRIQKDVINEYYSENKNKHYNGVSIMLLNTLKTCLYNLFTSKLSPPEIKEKINLYVQNESVMQCILNEGSLKYFSMDYLNAIKNKDIDYLFDLGMSMYKGKKVRRTLINAVSKLSFI